MPLDEIADRSFNDSEEELLGMQQSLEAGSSNSPLPSSWLLEVAAAALQETGLHLYYSNQEVLHGEKLVLKSSFPNVEATLNQDQKLKADCRSSS